MFAGFNCTIFAYGQTGTQKTYTMSADMNTNACMLSEAAGIIPRTLPALFNNFELNDVENSVKCSFLELYNEELRDLISADGNTKLRSMTTQARRGTRALSFKVWKSHISRVPLRVSNYSRPEVIDVKLPQPSATTSVVEVTQSSQTAEAHYGYTAHV
ncbi:kinesin-domain-containing protein [Cadophora sp. DSE1049]|nr:kinesin-domain-containing protein [Cadophora sp. DSE1049]